MRVMLIDDDSFMLDLTAECLIEMGVKHIDKCLSARDGLDIIEASPNGIDVILCDLLMPEMDGIEFARALGGLNFLGKIAFVSGAHETQLDVAGKLTEVGTLDYLGSYPKPLTMDDLHKPGP